MIVIIVFIHAYFTTEHHLVRNIPLYFYKVSRRYLLLYST